jgi:hypothetical protein
MKLAERRTQKEAAQAFVDSFTVHRGSKTVKLLARVPTRELKIEELSWRYEDMDQMRVCDRETVVGESLGQTFAPFDTTTIGVPLDLTVAVNAPVATPHRRRTVQAPHDALFCC